MFRRRRQTSETDDVGEIEEVQESPAPEVEDSDPRPDRSGGPWDSSELDLDDEERSADRLDLGALLLRPRPGIQIRIDVEDKTQRVRAVRLLSGRAGVQLQAFAAPRTTSIWADVRREIAADATKRGGLATEVAGTYGTELKVAIPGQTADGRDGTQTTRVVGIEGPRWLLRVMYFGDAADSAYAGELVDVVRDTIVVRGNDPMAPRDPLPLRLPPAAARVARPDGSSAAGPPSDGAEGA